MNIGSLVPGHYFTSCSVARPDGKVQGQAACECGLELTWGTREEEHAQHVLAVVWQQGVDDLAVSTLPGADPLTNPYEKTRTEVESGAN